MSLFLNTLSLHNHYLDCCAIDVSETIEHDCLSVLHKLHDQVNGLQLVQVVVQPLARLFNPASLAALVSNSGLNNQQLQSTYPAASNSNNNNVISNTQSSTGSHSNASTPSSQHAPPFIAASSNQQVHESDGVSSNQPLTHQSSIGGAISSAASTVGHSRGSSYVPNPSSSNNQNVPTASNTANSTTTATSTYMMSPDTAQALIARLDTDRDVNWLMEIIGYGLSLPFSITGEQDSVKDCCTIYCEWLASALLPFNETNEDSKYQQLSKLVPVPIKKEPNHYARKMLSHLYNVFLPRQNLTLMSNQKENHDAYIASVSRQALLCHRVLRTIETIAQNPSNLMDNQTWDHLLALLLTVNDKLLSAPSEPDNIGTQLQDRILGVLFELVLMASARSIPTQNIWKTFYSMTLNWRHRPALVEHWRRITLLLTNRIVFLSSLAAKSGSNLVDYSNEMSISNILDNSQTSIAIEQVIATMAFDNLAQTWYRFLNLIGNPVELSDPNIISRTDEFYHSACASDNVLDPRQHPCLNLLPQIFMDSMKGLRTFIEAFLGLYIQHSNDDKQAQTNEPQTPDRPPPSYNQSSRGSIISLTGKSTSVSITTFFQSTLNMQQAQQPTPIVTPTQPRKTGIKSIGKGVLPFTSGTISGASQDPSHATQPNEPVAKSRSGSSHKLAKLNQPKPTLNNIPAFRPPHINTQVFQQQFKLFSERPKCNSILHVFGDWLFSATLIGSDLNQKVLDDESTTSIGSASTATEVSGFSANYDVKNIPNVKSTVSGSQQSSYFSDQQDNLTSESTVSNKILLEPTLTANSFEAGQAEAMMILCRIFSSKSLSEDISPTYLSRFYLCLQHCLNSGINTDSSKTGATFPTMKRQLLASVLVNSTNLLQKDLDGINLLVPSFMKAIEFVFECGERDAPVQPPRQHSRSSSIKNETLPQSPNINNYDLRRACIMTLLNLLAYPFHFKDLIIRNCLNDTSPTMTFGSLRPRLLKLLFIALQTENDPTNMQVLFGALSLTIHDLAFYFKRPLERKESVRSRIKNDSQSTASGDQDSFSHGSGRRDAIVSDTSFVFNSTVGFLVKSLHVTCHLLINIWKHDTQVSLAALEFLTAVARVSASSQFMGQQNTNANSDESSGKIHNNENPLDDMRNEYKQATKWICDYICNQCSRPPPAHSRDMHSTIVAAYQCLSVWFHYHPYLLKDKNCIDVVMEVIELGVSGQKSKTTNINPTTGISSHTIVNKNEKNMKPSSMRVREAAESLLNICLIGSRSLTESMSKLFPYHDTSVDESILTELVGGLHCLDNNLEAYKSFKYFSDENSTIFGLLECSAQDQMTKDSLICLFRTPFGKHCWKIKFKYYAEKSKDKIIANKTLGLIKRPFQPQQCTTPSSEMRLFPFSGPSKSNYYFNNSAKYFPEAIDELAYDELDHLVTSLDDYAKANSTDFRLKSDLDKMSKIYSHQMLAEQKVSSECSLRIKRVDAEEPQPNNELDMARILVTHFGLETALIPIANDDRAFAAFVDELRQLDKQSVRNCDTVSIFYVRKGRTSPREILESVRERQNVSLSFFEWLLDLGEPTVVKQHSRWTGKVFNGAESSTDLLADSNTLTKNQMLMSNHGGAIFDGDRMLLYWSDMCQELSFLVHHKIESVSAQEADTQLFRGKILPKCNETIYSSEQQEALSNQQLSGKNHNQESIASHISSNQDQNSDVQSLSSFASDISSHSSRAVKLQQQDGSHDDHQMGHFNQQPHLSDLNQPRHSISVQKKKSTVYSMGVGCDTTIIICWLESQDDMQEIPSETLLSVAEVGHLVEYHQSGSSARSYSNQMCHSASGSAKYFISPMRNGLYRVNLTTSFGRQWLALPLVDGATVTKGALASLIRESVLNLCRRRRLDADSYQPPHLRRRIKIQEICNQFKVSSRHELTEFYNSLFSRSHRLPSASISQ